VWRAVGEAKKLSSLPISHPPCLTDDGVARSRPASTSFVVYALNKLYPTQRVRPAMMLFMHLPRAHATKQSSSKLGSHTRVNFRPGPWQERIYRGHNPGRAHSHSRGRRNHRAARTCSSATVSDFGIQHWWQPEHHTALQMLFARHEVQIMRPSQCM